ncbi:MAG: protein kinase [candidate division Zixibacteria bacterium]|nr:protein kinase [candidate division Zixibacteria bacterium]
MIGKTISHYKILEKLGEGGMGVVYKAQDIKLQRLVALKFLPPHVAENPEEKARFIQEAQSASALNHPNVTTIHGIEESPEGLFIAMEYIEGKTLKRIVEEETLSIKKVLDIGIQTCEGLALAHEKGIVHRDIKSDNIMVTFRGQVKIMDFGLAKLKGATKLTQTGSTLGTLAYMSPEQAQGEEVDQRSDIFSFGVILYELLTGKLPFAGEHQAAVIYSIINEYPQPVVRYNNQVSAKLEDMVFKALAKDKEERYQHADELLADLRRERKSLEYVKTAVTTQPAEPPKVVKRKTIRLLIGVLGILILIIVYFAFLKQKEPTTVSGKPSIAVLYLQNLSENKGDEYFAAGMTEDIITQLSKIGGLRVLSRSDVEEFKGKTVKPREVADKLKVNYVMEGSVRKYGDKIRIACQLIKASDGFHVWAESYDRQMEDLFAIQADVAKSVAQALKVALAPPELAMIEKKPTLNVQAYNYYLQGRQYYFRGADSKENLELATRMFEKALEVDSSFALAYAGLSDCYSSYVMFRVDPKKSWLEKAEKAGLKALALDQDLAEARRSLSRLYWTEGKTEKAIQEAEEAVKANPNYGEAWRLLGEWYTQTGQYPKAESAFMRALEVKPTESSLFQAIIELYSAWEKKEKVGEYFNKGLEIQPTSMFAYSAMIGWYIRWGELEEAKRMVYKALNIYPREDWALFNLMQIYLLSGETDSSSFYLSKARREKPDWDYFVETAYLALMRGNKKQAEIYLDSCIQFNQPLVKEFEGLPEEYQSRLRIGLAYALKGESRKALEQAERVRSGLGESLFSMEWAYDRGIVRPLSFVYSLTGQKQEAVRMLDFLVKNNIITPAYIKLHPWYKNLAGYPAFEELMAQKTK